MNPGIKKTFVLTTLIILIASITVTIYQISNFDEDERLFQRVYEEQLDALLFSVNQYAEDVVNSWKYDLRGVLSMVNPGGNMWHPDQQMNSVYYAFSKTPNENGSIVRVNVDYVSDYIAKIDSIVSANQQKIDQLFEYYDEGYNKIEPIYDPIKKGVLLLSVEKINNKKSIMGIAINPVNFIDLNLMSRITELSRNKFNVGIKYPTDPDDKTKKIEPDLNQINKKLWILPEFELYISIEENNIASLVSSKLKTNLLILISLSGLVLIASFFLFWIFRKEMKLAQMKTDFISNVSHELRTPLSLISMYAETLEMGRIKEDTKRDEYYKIISGEAERLSKIVNNILNFSKMEAGKRKYTFSKTDISSLMNHILSTYSFHLNKSGFTLSLDNKLTNSEVKCDSEALYEAIINLIDNAVKYCNDNKEIFISLTNDENRIFISIKDQGIGIPTQDINKIFEKFYRVSTGLRHNTKGTGIGLSIVKHIIDAHNGFINVKSKENNGSEFIIELPIDKGNYDV